MTSRDPTANYYDITLPDGTRTEVWSVLRAALTPEEALGYAKACLLTRIMRDGKKPGVDRMREAEKIGIEAGMLREAMEAYLATPRAIAVTVSCDDPAARIAELERERDEARVGRRAHNATLAELDGKKRIIRETLQENANLRRDLTAEREAHEATRKELERVRVEAKSLALHDRAERQAAAATAEELERVRERLEGEVLHHTDTLREGTKLRAELAALRDRYRARLQSEEPAPENEGVLEWVPQAHGLAGAWMWMTGKNVSSRRTWTHQPPAPEEEV